jgi:choline dehydrogenase-like flavoprotein
VVAGSILDMNPETSIWDAVIVGTGMGGATLGYALAKAGRRVLFVERGLDLRAGDSGRIYGRFVEEDSGFRNLSEAEQLRMIALGGRSTDQIDDHSNSKVARFTPYIGCGTGGSSALYGMVLERLFPVDFVPGAAHRGDSGSSLPEAWPISYQDLRPWYESAERLYRVRGGADPLRWGEAEALLPAPTLSPESADIIATLKRQGVHPYRLHTACEQVDGCRTCQGHLCGLECKNEAAGVCLTPAVEKHDACLLTECVALFLDADRSKVRRLVCSWRGQRIELRSKIFVLAAGALLTPALLLNSKSASWPDGLANASDLVGGNLMRHSIDLYVLTKSSRLREGALTKEVAFNDLYAAGSDKFGSVQSFGISSPLGYLRNRPGFNIWRLLGPAAPYLWKWYARRPILGAIMEDLPYAQNRVTSEGAITASGRYRLSLHYRLGSGDLIRRQRFRRALAQVLAPFKPVRAWGTTDRPALGHACGTCRFGAEPETSVLDPWNRAHGVSNLYVVDASFFPTSGGLNPALTIAANALRVAHHIESTTLPG